MTKVASFLFCVLLGGTFVVSHVSPLGISALAFEPIHQSLVVKIKKDKKDDDDDDDDDKPKKKKGDKGKKPGGETGLTDCTIIQPNGGGGCKTGFKWVCEKLKSGKKCCGCVADPNAPPPPEKCKIPGQVGTPPNCNCPSTTDLVGNACVPYTYKEAYCFNPTTPDGGFNTQASTDMAVQCKAAGGYGDCKTKEKCCCNVKVYAK